MLSVQTLDLQDARAIIDAACERAHDLGVPMCVAVADCRGVTIALVRMDGGKVTSVALAQDKAYTAAGAQQDTEFYATDERSPGWRIHNTDGGRFSTLRGGICIRRGCEVVGSIGVSGGSGEQDIDVARAGLDALETRERRSP